MGDGVSFDIFFYEGWQRDPHNPPVHYIFCENIIAFFRFTLLSMNIWKIDVDIFQEISLKEDKYYS